MEKIIGAPSVLRVLKVVTWTILLGLGMGFSWITLAVEEYNPKINPKEFTNKITNPYFTLTPGKEMEYEKETGDGLETVEVEVTKKTKNILGVRAVVVRDRVWLEDELIEDTRDYFAQDKQGNVWYFGEQVDNYENGKLVDHDGSWLAGVDGAKPGIIMKAKPKVGESYRQEYYPGVAEDMAKVLALNETVRVPAGTFKNCLKTLDWTPLDPGVEEHKYYCKQAGGVALEVSLKNQERLELLEIETAKGEKRQDD